MNFDIPKNKNYCAVIVKIRQIIPLDNCDNVVATPLFGFQAVVDKKTEVGELGVFFPAETRLSDQYCMENNLYRHSDMNRDESSKGYIEDNRRVKAVKFRGNPSNCLLMPLSSLEWTGINIADLKEGDEFDQIGEYPICEKYERPVTISRAQRAQDKAFKRVDTKFLPEHYDNENYFRNSDHIGDETEIIVTQKLHGTSIRIGNTIVLRRPTLVDRLLRFFGVETKNSEFDYVYGSRHSIKDINNPDKQHFYSEDIWTTEGSKLVGCIPQNFVVYGELVGWTQGGGPIQKNYTYQQPEGTCKLYVYRVAIVNGEGMIIDLSWDHVKEFCAQRGLNCVRELWRGKKRDFDAQKYLDVRFCDQKRRKFIDTVVQLDDNRELVDEGVCIRVDTIVPTIYKAKSPIFLEHETKLIDEGAADLEAEQSTEPTDAT
jgi:hypothetical protein